MKNEDRPILTGKRFGKLVVHEFSFGGGGWRCVCDCGKERRFYTHALTHGSNQSCGCLSAVKILRTGHGMSRWPEYLIWTNIKRRCSDPKHKDFRHYGGRGIFMRPEWMASFCAFISGAKRRPEKGLWLERLDNNKGYEPGNVAWVTPTIQQRNRRNNRLVFVRGENITLREAVERFASNGVCFNTARSRIRRGWDAEKAITQKLRCA